MKLYGTIVYDPQVDSALLLCIPHRSMGEARECWSLKCKEHPEETRLFCNRVMMDGCIVYIGSIDLVDRITTIVDEIKQ